MAEIGQVGAAQAGNNQVSLQRLEAAGGKGASAQALAVVSLLRHRFEALPPKKRSWLIASILFLVAACAGMVWFVERPDWRVLFSGLEGKDAQQVTQELAAAGIPYQVTEDGGGVQVPAEMLDKARMEVASKGMPQSGRLGFELFDKPNWVGSEFDERVNYQRALEGELEHTIGTISAVKSARVHLVLPQQSLFVSEQRPAKASVVLKLRRSSMDPEQAEAIRNLVSGSVENLNPDQVTLVDADGRVSMKPRTKDAAAGDLEQGMEAKLVAMLEPLAGQDNVRATVNVSYDEGAEERTDEMYDPTQVAALTVQKNDQSSNSAGRSQGVPGTASNSPAGSPAGAVAGSATAAAPGTPPLLQKDALPVYPQAGGSGQTLHQENSTYAVTKRTIHTEEGPGRIRRLTAAVLVNDRLVTQGEGKTAQAIWKPRSADEMHRLEQLAQAAVGFDANRGDQVVIENVSFSTNAPPAKIPAAEKMMDELKSLLRTEPGMMRTLMIGLSGVLMVLFVFTPVAKQVNALLKEPSPQPALLSSVESPTSEVRELAAGEPPEEEPVKVLPRASQLAINSGVFDRVSEHIRREPVQSVKLLESWIGTEGED